MLDSLILRADYLSALFVKEAGYMEKYIRIMWIADLLWVLVMTLIFTDRLLIGGVCGYILWAIPIVLSVFLMYLEKSARKYLIPVLVVGILLSLLSIRSGRKLIKENTEGKNYTAVYELNAGAMSHTSYVKKQYYTVFDSGQLSVRWCTDSKSSRYDDGL